MVYVLIELAVSAILLLIVFFVLWKVRFRHAKLSAIYYIFAVYLAAVYHVVGLPTVQFIRWEINLNCLPFVGMLRDLRGTILNVLLFVPLGFFLPLLWNKFRRTKHTLLFGLRMTIAIELLQLFTYRVTDINDIMTNTLGTFLGFCLFRFLKQSKPCKCDEDIAWIFSAVLFVMFFVQPVLMRWIYLLI